MNQQDRTPVVSDTDDFEEREAMKHENCRRHMMKRQEYILNCQIAYSDIQLFSLNDEFLKAKANQYADLANLVATYASALPKLTAAQVDLYYSFEHSWNCIPYCIVHHCLADLDKFQTDPGWINPVNYKCLCPRQGKNRDTFPEQMHQILPSSISDTPNDTFDAIASRLLNPAPFTEDFGYQKMDLIESCHDLKVALRQASIDQIQVPHELSSLAHCLEDTISNCTAKRPMPKGVTWLDPTVKKGCVSHCHRNNYRHFIAQRHWIHPFDYACHCNEPTPPYTAYEYNQRAIRNPRMHYDQDMNALGRFPSIN